MRTDTLLGKQIDEYRIETALGAGGMARVYRALDVKLRRYIALKVIAPDFRTDPDYAARFEREAQSLARLEHPNVVRIHRFGEVDGLYYMAMQYVEGSDLAWLIQDYRANGEVMPITDIARVVQDITAALDYIHGKGVIHRDVKPHNVIVDSRGHAVLTDFGLALLSDRGAPGEMFGSPRYLSPEQADSSGQVVPQSDLYSLGVTLFEMLTGEVPFNADNPADLAMQHRSQLPTPPSQVNLTIPRSVDEVVLRSLEKKPYDRYQTGAELNTAFQQAIADWQATSLSGDPAAGHPASAQPLVAEAWHETTNAPTLEALSAVPSQTATGIPQDFLTKPISLPEQIVEPTVAHVTQAATLALPVEGQPIARSASPTRLPTSKIRWRSPLIIAAALYAVGLISMVLFFAATRRPGPLSGVILPTTIDPSPTTIALTPTSTATRMATSTPAPTLVPLPPTDRNVVPMGSRRLGEFAVEGFCNSRGYGVVIVNHQADWACTNPSNGMPVLTLGPKDFDGICQTRYNAPTAFAIRDQQKLVRAYNWSCYDYVELTPTLIATPSIASLLPQFNANWVALINISNFPLAVDGIVFKRDDGSTLKGADWGQTMLPPGDCLRLYTGTNPPATLPARCNNAIDYPGSKDDRWLNDKVTITINPSTAYCYPSDKCAK